MNLAELLSYVGTTKPKILDLGLNPNLDFGRKRRKRKRKRRRRKRRPWSCLRGHMGSSSLLELGSAALNLKVSSKP